MRESEMLRLAMNVVVAEEIARQISSKLVDKITVTVQPIPKPHTRLVELSNVEIRDQRVVLDLKDPGHIKELMVKSSTPDFGLAIQWDNNALIKTFKELSEVSQEVDAIAAFQGEDTYIVNISDISWTDQLKITIFSTGKPVTIKRLLCIYELYT